MHSKQLAYVQVILECLRQITSCSRHLMQLLMRHIFRLMSRTKIYVKQVLINYSINTNFTTMASIIMINNLKWGCLAIGIFQKYQLDHKFLCLLHTNKLPDICTARSRLRKSPRRVLQTHKHM